MSRILILSEPRVEGPGATPLERSVKRQTDGRSTLDPANPDIVATALIDIDTALRPDAIALLHEALEMHPMVDALIGDAITGGTRQLRPAWSPTRLASTAHELDLVVVRERIDDPSLAGRIAALTAVDDLAVGHLPAALVERDAPLQVDAKAEAALAQACIARRSADLPDSVTFLIPSAGTPDPDGHPMVLGAIDAARRARVDGGPDDEIVVVVGDEFVGNPDSLSASDVRIVHRGFTWNFAAAMNLGLIEASNGTVVLLNDDIKAPEPGWLTPMLEHLGDPDVGLVGASLSYPDGTLQHHGMVIDDAFPLHAYVGMRPGDLPQPAQAAHEVAAVTAACAVGRRSQLLEIGGFWEALPESFNDTDLCLKLQRSGRRVILEPRARLIHFESASRLPSIEPWEWDTFIGRWGCVDDPWYHPGHHRPDNPEDRRRNADHLPALDPLQAWPLRTSTVRPRPHHARMRPEALR